MLNLFGVCGDLLFSGVELVLVAAELGIFDLLV